MASTRASIDGEESRVARKRREARARIIRAAEQLMRTRPVEAVTIGDITSAADVGHGSFYLHFRSKYEVLVPVVRATAERWDARLQTALSGCEDPAEVVGFSTRYMGRLITGDPLWRWLLRHSGMPMDTLRDAVGRFAARDIGRGLLSGRFQLPDLPAANSFLFGGFVAGLLTSLDAENPEQAIDQMAELLLRSMGLPLADAERIGHQPLPTLESEENGT